MHPADGVTLYIREISPLGELNDLFLSDSRKTGEQAIYTARQALIVRAAAGPRLVMLDGMAQQLTQDTRRRVAVTHFADFTLDLSGIISSGKARSKSLREFATPALLIADQATQTETGAARPALREEGHSRLAGPLLGIAAPLLGFAALMLGSFSRFGLWRQMGVAVLLIILLQTANTAASSLALRSDSGWIALYLVPLAGMAVAGLLMVWSQRPRRIRGAQGAAGEVPA